MNILELTDDEVKELLKIMHDIGCCYPMGGLGTPMEGETIEIRDSNGNVLREGGKQLPFRYAFPDDKYKTLYDKVFALFESLFPFTAL